MAFFEQIGAAITNASNAVTQKTSNFSEVNNLNKMINANQTQIQNMYIEIGRMYYEAHKEDADAEYAQQCAIIKEAFNNIAKLQDQIRVVKGIAVCPNCGAEVAGGSLFCQSCGMQVAQPAPQAPVQPNMQAAPQAPVQPNVQAAPQAPVQPNVQAAPQAPVQPNVQAAPQAPVQPNVQPAPQAPAQPTSGFCTQCGSQVPADSSFCPICGQKM